MDDPRVPHPDKPWNNNEWRRWDKDHGHVLWMGTLQARGVSCQVLCFIVPCWTDIVLWSLGSNIGASLSSTAVACCFYGAAPFGDVGAVFNNLDCCLSVLVRAAFFFSFFFLPYGFVLSTAAGVSSYLRTALVSPSGATRS